MKLTKEQLKEKLLANINLVEGPLETPCWVWTGAQDDKGYGRLRTERAHRLSYELHIGPIPSYLWCLHKCDNPLCCNPEHLYLGTAQDNSDDMRARGREVRVANAKGYHKGTLNPASKLNDEPTINEGLVEVVSPPYLEPLLTPRLISAAMQNDRFIVRWTVDEPMCQTFLREKLALKKVRELFNKYGQDFEVEIHLNRVGPSPSVLYNSKRLRKWFQQSTTSP